MGIPKTNEKGSKMNEKSSFSTILIVLKLLIKKQIFF